MSAIKMFKNMIAVGIVIAIPSGAATTLAGIFHVYDYQNYELSIRTIFEQSSFLQNSSYNKSHKNSTAQINTNRNEDFYKLKGKFGPKYANYGSGRTVKFNNGRPSDGAAWFGSTIGDGKNNGKGWPKNSDMQELIDLGVSTIRLPILPKYCLNEDGTINRWVISNLSNIVKYNMRHGVSTVLDSHTYLPFSDQAVAEFWSKFAPAMEVSIGGPSPLFGIELSNEPGKSSRNLINWTEPLRNTIHKIRISGYKGYIFAGSGDWNNITFLPSALAEVERTGGVLAMDPQNRTIYTAHDYWNKDKNPGKTRNDQGQAVDGLINIKTRYDIALNMARRIGAKIVVSEIGGGISPTGPLPAFNGIGKDGGELQEEYFSYAKSNRDVLLGTWFWTAGKVSPNYRHRIKAGNLHTESLRKFWSNK